MGRMALEQRYAFPGMPGAFITLTYDDDHLPEDGSLRRKDLHDFMDYIRRSVGKTERFFAVGEYGSRTFRPHFHVIHFGAFGNEAWSRVYNQCWKRGYIQVGQAEGAVLNYVTGYVTKKLDQMHQLEIEDRGLVPEFFSCSRRPPLGDTGLKAIGRLLNTDQAATSIAHHGFPRGFNLGGRYFPFFRRDRLKVLRYAGYDDMAALKEENLQRQAERSWLWLEEAEVYRNAQAFAWDPPKLLLELQKLEEDQHGKATEAEIERARARAFKFRRREAAKRHSRRLDS